MISLNTDSWWQFYKSFVGYIHASEESLTSMKLCSVDGSSPVTLIYSAVINIKTNNASHENSYLNRHMYKKNMKFVSNNI